MAEFKMERAILLTSNKLDTGDAKTAHGLIRESGRYQIVGVCDQKHAGRDAGEVLDGKPRKIPVFGNVAESMSVKPEVCIVGLALTGGMFTEELLEEVKTAIRHKLSIVSGLHDKLNERPEIVKLAKENGVELTDIRAAKKFTDLHFWTGKVKEIATPIVAVIGTDCSLGKRTTTKFVINACRAAGINAQMIYTGQTGWLQGGKYGFILDSTLNDFVSGELEHAILSCEQETHPDVIFIEGQSALRNPSGPCGSELLISGNAKSVILVHAPAREYYEHDPAWGAIPTIESEMALVRQLGSSVIALALNTEGLSKEKALAFQKDYQEMFNIPVVLPIIEGCEKVVPAIQRLSRQAQAIT